MIENSLHQSKDRAFILQSARRFPGRRPPLCPNSGRCSPTWYVRVTTALRADSWCACRSVLPWCGARYGFLLGWILTDGVPNAPRSAHTVESKDEVSHSFCSRKGDRRCADPPARSKRLMPLGWGR